LVSFIDGSFNIIKKFLLFAQQELFYCELTKVLWLYLFFVATRLISKHIQIPLIEIYDVIYFSICNNALYWLIPDW